MPDPEFPEGPAVEDRRRTFMVAARAVAGDVGWDGALVLFAQTMGQGLERERMALHPKSSPDLDPFWRWTPDAHQ